MQDGARRRRREAKMVSVYQPSLIFIFRRIFSVGGLVMARGEEERERESPIAVLLVLQRNWLKYVSVSRGNSPRGSAFRKFQPPLPPSLPSLSALFFFFPSLHSSFHARETRDSVTRLNNSSDPSINRTRAKIFLFEERIPLDRINRIHRAPLESRKQFQREGGSSNVSKMMLFHSMGYRVEERGDNGKISGVPSTAG